MKTGLVLEGGGMRGIYTCGILDRMIQYGFEPDVLCGTSAGAIFGINLPSKQRGRAFRYNYKHIVDPDYVSLRSLLKTGNMVNVDFAYNRIPNELDPVDEKAFEQSKTKVFATVTNVRTGKAEYKQITNCYEQIDWLRASGTLPFISHRVKIDGEEYLDGGLVDNIPLDKAFEEGCDKVVVVLTRPLGFRINEPMYGLSRLFYPEEKNLQAALKMRSANYRRRMEQIRQLKEENKIFVFAPMTILPIRRLERNPLHLKKIYEIGLRDGRNRWQELEKYLQQE
ncbi:MAG: patatin family protein [Paludibacteraceae bacterium]